MHPGPQGTASFRAGSHGAFPARGQGLGDPLQSLRQVWGHSCFLRGHLSITLHSLSTTIAQHPESSWHEQGAPPPSAQGCPPLTWHTLASFLRLPGPPFAEPHGAACHVQGVPERLVSLPRPSHPAGLGQPLPEGSPRPRIWTEALSPPAAARKAACGGLASECCPRSHVPGRSGPPGTLVAEPREPGRPAASTQDTMQARAPAPQ